MNKEMNKVYRKTVAIGLSFLAGASIALTHPEKTVAQNNEISMNPITTVEDIYNDNLWTQEIIHEYYQLLNPKDKNKYKYIGIPMNKINISYIDKYNKVRSHYYNLLYVPRFAINGKIEKQNTVRNWNDFIGIENIKEGIKTKKQYANFSLQIDNNPESYTLN